MVNDGFTDQTATIVEQYMQKDDRITFITQENRGAAITHSSRVEFDWTVMEG